MAKKKNSKNTIKQDLTVEDNLFKKTISMLNPEEGRAVFQSLSKVRNRQLIGVSTGSIGLDYSICPKAGGMPVGHCIEFYGPYSSGKTTLALGICANITAQKKQVIYVDAERSFSPELAINAGIDEEYFILCQHRDARLIANNLETLMKTGSVGAIVIDSIPFWKPLLEGKKGNDDVDITKSQMAAHASFLTLTLPILAQVASDHDVILIFINQERKNLNYGGGSVPYGCEALKHLDSVRLKLKGNAKYKDSKILDSDDNLVGQYVEVLVDKNKVGVPMKELVVPLFFGRGVNPYMEAAKLAVKLGIVTNAAGRINWADSGESLAHGIDNFTQMLFDDKELYFKLRDKLIQILGVRYTDMESIINSFHDGKGEKRVALSIGEPNFKDTETDIEEELEATDE